MLIHQRPYTNSTFTRRPTIAAARCRLPSVMSRGLNHPVIGDDACPRIVQLAKMGDIDVAPRLFEVLCYEPAMTMLRLVLAAE